MIVALSRTFKEIESDWISNLKNGVQGSCCIVGCLHGISIEALQLYVANLGDSRGVLCRGGSAVEITSDHKPNRPDELERVRSVGGTVARVANTWRVFDAETSARQGPSAMLAVSRAFGDRDLKKPKKIVSAVPEITVIPLSPIDLFLVLACDGVWDVLSNQEVVDIVSDHWENPEEAARAVRDAAVSKGSADDITVIVVMFAWQQTLAGDILRQWRMNHKSKGTDASLEWSR
mmetsp:Transcript_17753/g.43419  ORF Transcript_17753/g.43419 Transcript_17753/m.43419 type:complete len:233 (-) Transcript_17753:56-754(-)